MKNKIYSLLISFLFIPLILVGQLIGNLLGYVLYFIYENIMWLNIPKFISEIAPIIIGAAFAGFFSAFIIIKIYNSVNFLYVSIVPWLVSVIIFAGYFITPLFLSNLQYDLMRFGESISIIVTIITFHIYLKNRINA